MANTPPTKTWRLPQPAMLAGLSVGQLAESLRLPPVVVQLLVQRGLVETVDDIPNFLNPTLRDLPHPNTLAGMEAAVARLVAAIQQRETVSVFGDYDVDGQCSTALMVRYLRQVGVPVLPYIPNRFTEGYGPNAAALASLKQQGATLCVTVDCGIVAYEPLQAAMDSGLDIIVTDHHQAQPELPPAVAVVNPNRLDDTSGLGMLCGCGVAFFMLMALNKALREGGFFTPERPEPNLLHLLDLVALATVADLMQLRGANRALVKRGLQQLAHTQNLGLRALMDVAGITLDKLDTDTLGFQLGPRLNAAGRLDDAMVGLQLLVTEESQEAQRLAGRLQKYNEDRKQTEKAVRDKALLQAQSLHTENHQRASFCVVGDDFHEGVIGLAASKVVSAYYRPTFVFGKSDKSGDGAVAYKGSGRGIAGLDIGAAIHHCKQQGLCEGGGHAMAAGCSVKDADFQTFARTLETHLQQQIAEATQAGLDVLTPKLNIDAEISPVTANAELLNALTHVAPFGQGNPSPLFLLKDVSVAFAKAIGSDETHLKCALQDAAGNKVQAVAFGVLAEGESGATTNAPSFGHALLNTKAGEVFDVVGDLKTNYWNGQTRVDFHMKDARAV